MQWNYYQLVSGRNYQHGVRNNFMFYNVPMLYEGGEIDAHLVSLAQMTNSSTTVQLRNAAPLLYSICWQQYFFRYD
jgi:hypothetical protein